MSAESTEMLSNASQLLAARESELASMNATRLDNWQRRYWHRCIEVPTPKDAPKWPANRSSVPNAPISLTTFRKGRGK